jgi:hypothetical protein
VHRTEVHGPSGEIEWLTLPIARQPRDVLIKDIAFAPGAREALDERIARYAWLADAQGPAAERIRAHLHGPLISVIDYLELGLRLVADLLGFNPVICRSSTFGLPPTLRSQERVIAAVEAVGGLQYINAPGGRALYDPALFARRGLKLSFLTPYEGPHKYFLPALLTESIPTILEDVRASSRLESPT